MPLVVANAEAERRLRDLENRRELFECGAEIVTEDGLVVEEVSYS
jgi:hypothetical protein